MHQNPPPPPWGAPPPPPRRQFNWNVVWQAVGAVAGVAAVAVALVTSGVLKDKPEGTNGTVTAGPGQVTPTNVSTSPTTAQSSGVLTAGERALRDLLPTVDYPNCWGNPKEENANVSAALNCEVSGPGRYPLILQYASGVEAVNYLRGRFPGVTDATGANCQNGRPYRGPWMRDGVAQGTMICAYSDGYHSMTWSYNDRSVIIIAEDKDHAVLWNWWRGLGDLKTA